MKGFMDTIPKALDEAATLDGCTRWQIFTKITLPLSKPMIVYQIITSFMAPWVDFVFAKVICRTNSQYFTVSIGLWSMLEKEYVDTWFVRFCAGAVLVSIPIAILFMITQKFYQEAMSGAVKGLMPGLPRPMHPERRTPLWKLPGNDLPASAAMGCGHGGCSFFWPGCWAKASCRTVC